ncbi:glycoside hydrolase family 27 protein [Sediminicola luteus]|uniref:Alpha-galactosidase n=1 Tax=Sediminicola luteus TaxID=319238 RepID=A0A2A4GDB6_9FLAO|nr:glycoside hydrolase family 27 protein [Sediminicola luteus]PCE65974.1 alpha-galactosidase [Sediminicola luteus]
MIVNINTNHFLIVWSMLLVLVGCAEGQKQEIAPEEVAVTKPKTPIMGWASWNNYRVHINEDIIKSQADAMDSNGMKEAGYTYINTDDGFFGGRDSLGNLLAHQERFPSGMGALARYIHDKGLKAGIYSDAGINTCASYWDKDTIGSGMGLYGHDYKDLTKMLREWDYDFIKIDWCGGEWLGLDEQTRYTEIARQIEAIKPETVFNICRWKFPGEWALDIADSWRISGDIHNSFESIMRIVDLNADLWKYSGPGHFNDMDMLQIGRGMSYEEDKTHFSMWCIMNSPLLAGNDLTQMSNETLSILTQSELIALNQDPLCYQARRLKDDGDLEVWAKPLGHTMSGRIAVTLLNRSEVEKPIGFHLDSLGIQAHKGYTLRDLWEKTDLPLSNESERVFVVPAHGVKVFTVNGTAQPFNVFQFK